MQLHDEQVTTDEVVHWKGLHLLHFQASSCSQKVRILLREKRIDWESHPVDLARQENTKPWFLGINPRGVVPVLVHDGAVHVESNDILEYLDAQIPSPVESYFPQTEEERAFVKASLAREDGLHADLRTITMGFLVPKRLAQKSGKTLDEFEKGGAPDEKRAAEVAWWRDYLERGITAEQAKRSFAAFRDAFGELEARLADRPWLIGERISVLEIAWFISIHRLVQAGYPIDRQPRLAALYRALLERPAFQRETDVGWRGAVLEAYGAFRRLTRTGLMDVVE